MNILKERHSLKDQTHSSVIHTEGSIISVLHWVSDFVPRNELQQQKQIRAGDYLHRCYFAKLWGRMKDTGNFSATSIMQDHIWNAVGVTKSSHFATSRYTLKIWVLHWKYHYQISEPALLSLPKSKSKNTAVPHHHIQSKRWGLTWRNRCYLKKWGTALLEKNHAQKLCF